MLCEGSSIRAIERITGINRNTIMNLGVRVGNACAKIHDEKMRGLTCNHIQVDEIWGFIGAKRKIASQVVGCGDVWMFIGLDSETKVIPSFLVGKRDGYHAKTFMDDLASRMTIRVQLSSDALSAYNDAVECAFGYGQVVKTYSVTSLCKEAAQWYSPTEVVKIDKTVVSGMPDIDRITTSHIEKQNHTLRMRCRRLTRLTMPLAKSLKILRLRSL